MTNTGTGTWQPQLTALVAALVDVGALHTRAWIDAFSATPRHLFTPQVILSTAEGYRQLSGDDSADRDQWLSVVYSDDSLVTQHKPHAAGHTLPSGQPLRVPTSSSTMPSLMARMLETLDVHDGMRVLEIGTGTGYNAALLAHIVGNPQLVFSVELDSSLAHSAQEKIDAVVGKGTTVHAGNGLDGYTPGSPYNRIIATGSYHKVPLPWLDQLKEGGVLVMNLGRDRATAMGILQLEKVGPKRKARGKFLSPAYFMQLREPGQVPGLDARSQFSQNTRRPVAAKFSISRAEFDPTLLMDMQFAFLVSCELPHSSLMWIPEQEDIPFTLNLLDTESETIVRFRPTEEAGVWQVQVRGAIQTWERLFQAYQQWVKLGRPKMLDYVFEVDEEGGQLIKIPGERVEGQSATWVIS